MESAEVERDLADLDVSYRQPEPFAAMNPLVLELTQDVV